MLPVEKIISGGAILFLGAGFSVGAKNYSDNSIYSGAQLKDKLLKDCDIQDVENYDLETASDEYEHKYGTEALIKLLSENFRASSTCDYHTTIVCQPWKRIYTSNYDDVIEVSAKIGKKQIINKEVSDSVEAPLNNVTQVVHIYGNLSRISKAEFKHNFLLSESQRDIGFFSRSPWYRRLSDDVLTASVVVFVGFSMYDLDLKRLIGAMPDFVTDKIYFVSKSIKDDANTRRLSRLGKVIGIGTQGFATELGHLRLDFPPKDPGLLPVFVREPEYKVESKFNDRDIRDLLVSGITKTTLFSVGDLNGNSDAYTVRRADKNSWIRLVAKQQRPMLVHGEVGAGKTVLLNQISYAKHCLGRKVFFIDREIGNAKDIIEYFNYYENECSIFFDDINGFPTLIKGILALEKSSIEIYVGARTNLLVAGVGTINSRMNNQSYSTYEVTQLSRTEIRRFSEYLTLNGIWARDAELSSFEKENLIVTRCGSNVRDLILYLYEDGALHSRVLEIVSALQNLQKAERSLFILCAIASIAGLSSSFDLTLLQEISEYPGTIDDIENTIKAQGVTGLIERSSGEIKFKSAVIAEFYLRNAVSPSEIFDVSFAALVNLEKFFWDDENINFYCRELLKFSLYERAIGRRRLGDMNRDFFHRCRVLKISQKDPLFHVQRSIAALSMNDFELSEKYIETAYAIARTRTKFDPYQVDTHKAKFIFMRALASNTPPDLAEIYDAFSLLQGVLKRRSSDLYHPISAMRQMSDIAKKFNQSFNSEDRSKFLSYLNSAAQIAQKTADQGKYNEIRRIHNSLKSAIDILKN